MPTPGPAALLSAHAPADLPPKTGRFWELVGPGAVLVGLSVGAGELIIWPRMTAQFGAAMTWAALLGIFLQLWINMEIGRYTLATGESVYTGYARISRTFAWIFLALTVVGWIVPGWARACGGALKVLLVGPEGWGSPWMWTAITFATVAAVLFGPRMVYSSVERTTETLVCLITAGLLLVGLSVRDTGAWADLARGAINFPYTDPALPPYELFAAIVFAGAGGTANLFYSFYVLDKGWGMGALVPALSNPLRGREERRATVGYTIRHSDTNARRWRDWFGHLCRDQVIFFWMLNSFTMLLFILGAHAVLHPAARVPTQELLVWEEAAILGHLWGRPGQYLFLLVGVACLFTTQLTLVDGVARSCADILHTNFRWARSRPVAWWYGVVAALWMAVGTGLTYAYEALPPILFLLSAGFFGGIAMAIYCPLTLLINVRFLPRAARPSPLRVAVLAAISIFYIAFAIAAVWNVIAVVRAGNLPSG
jgi:hypothetical protein